MYLELMKVSILLGSIREGRHSHRVAYHLQDRLSSLPGVEVRTLDLMEYDLPMLKNRWKEQLAPDNNLAEIGKILNESEALIFVSPEYHGSYSGVLKNAVDHYWSEFKRKPIGVVSTGSGKFGGINGSTEMQHLILSLGAFPMPFKLLVSHVKSAFNENNQPLKPDLEKDIQKFVDEFVWFSRALVNAKRSEPVS